MYVPYDRYGGVRGRGGEEKESSEGERTNKGLGILFLIFDFFLFFVSRHHFFLSVTSIMSSSPRFDVASFVHSSGT